MGKLGVLLVNYLTKSRLGVIKLYKDQLIIRSGKLSEDLKVNVLEESSGRMKVQRVEV